MTDPTPAHRRSPMEHERDAGPDPSTMDDEALLAQINCHDPYDVEFARRFRALRTRLAEAEERAEEQEGRAIVNAAGLRLQRIKREAADAKAHKLTDQLDYAIHRYEMSGNVTELVDRARSIVAKAMDERAKGGD